jgi:type II secretory ATPase GspE/PulE/Tfp pilus assembly ATPase PilB-like protein
MLRTLLVLVVLAACFATATPAWSEDFGTFPDHPGVSPSTLATFPLGPGFYLNWLKILGCWLLFLVWVRTVDWINRDGHELKLDYRRWNAIVFGSFLFAYILLWIVPLFWLDFPLLVIAYIVPLVVYVKYRNSTVTVDEAVFTRPHLRYWLSQRLRLVGIKMAAEPPGKHGNVPPVDLEARGADDRQNSANLLLARQSPGCPELQILVADMIARRGDAALFNFTQDSVATRYLIDGVWHDVEPRDRPTGDALLAVIKTISALNPEQRVARQQGSFGAAYEKVKYACKVTSQGTTAGERVLLQLDGKRMANKRLADLDMRQKMLDDFKALLETPGGLVVISTPPSGGLSTLFSTTVASMDCYVRSFVGIESAAHRELKVENLVITAFDPAAGQTPAAVLPRLIREHPDVFIVPDFVDAESASILCNQATEQRRTVVTSVRAKDASEALLRILMLKVPPQQFAAAVVASLNSRLLRKLCDNCKEAYTPPPNVLEQLGIPAGRIEAFYRPPQPQAEAQEVCQQCAGIGYYGRMALFELLVVDAGVREALVHTPQLAAVRQAARKAGMRTLQEEGIVLVAKGVTSLAELMRVLKE